MLSKKTVTEILSSHFKRIQQEPNSAQTARRLDALQADILRDIERAADETALASRKEKTESSGTSGAGGKGSSAKGSPAKTGTGENDQIQGGNDVS